MMLVLIVGPSGAGKDTLLNAARASLAGDSRVVFTQREITRGEAPGEDHLPIDAASFAARRDGGLYALCWEAHGFGYGISRSIEHDLHQGRVVVASVSRAVIAETASRYPCLVVEITASPDVLAQRLALRGREGAEEIRARLARQVAVPASVTVVTLVNDGSVAAGAERLVEIMLAAKQS
jgi:ribose 1,5-bisphosphokinase